MRLSLRTLTQNWQLKLAALTLAILLWVVVSAEQITTQWIPVPVRVATRDPEFVVTGGPIPEQVEVRFAGPGRELWELALDRPVLVLPLTDVERENQVFVLDPRSMVRIPNGLSVTPLDVRPSSVRVLTQRVVTREVPVRVRIARRSRERYVVLDTPQVSPATVRVTGPADRVEALDAVVTEPLDLAGADSDFRVAVPLDADSLAGLRPSIRSVEVSGRVDRLVERIIPSIRVAPVDGAAVVPARVDVRVQGPARQVRAVDPASLTVSIAGDSVPDPLPPQGATAPVRVGGLPAGLTAQTVPVVVRLLPPNAEPFPDTAPPAAVPVPEPPR
ncbi:MAG TPA: YbbR-like domain-containing protein [Longimicrobiaceae bacterium]|nr:YbbR-like domain-containing protein [Longimicrobiaceae bacterium]